MRGGASRTVRSQARCAGTRKRRRAQTLLAELSEDAATGGQPKDDVIDAEFKEVDDDKKKSA